MTTVVQTSVDVDATPEQVWRVVADPRNLGRWDRHIARVEGVTGQLHEGDEYTTEVRFLGVRARARLRVMELKPGEYSKVRMAGLVDGTVETWVEPLNEHRSRLRHRVEYRFRGGPLGELAARAVGMMGAGAVLRHGALAQKRQVEGAEG
jgi:carbon monoxide dehydrogenase subunit G